MAGPTRGATESSATWRASRAGSFAIRSAAFLTPIVAAYVAIRLVGTHLIRPTGTVGLVVWILQAAAVGALVSHAVGRLTRRLLPLAALMQLTLVFPDRAPSRFGVALRSGTVKQMRERAQVYHRDGLGSSPAEAAENAIVLVNGLGRHDRLTRGHTERVRAYADLIAEEMGLSDDDRNGLAWGVLLHDVGKIEVPAAVLNKKEKLTDDEWQQLKRHPAIGAEMLRPLAPWLGEWVGAAGEHHERWDGKGYPTGLAGTDISLAGRITAVADAYDVITSKRSYKEPMSNAAAREELVRCSGGQFDPAVVRAMLNASVGRSRSAGWLAWLTEIPIVRAGVSVATSPAVGAAAFTTAAVLGLADDSAERRTAFAAELEQLTATATTDVPTAVGATPLDQTAEEPAAPEPASTGDDRRAAPEPAPDVAATVVPVVGEASTGAFVDTSSPDTTLTPLTTTPAATIPLAPVTTSTSPSTQKPNSDGAAPSTTLAPFEQPAGSPTGPTTSPTTIAAPGAPGAPTVVTPSTTAPVLLPSIELPSVSTPAVTTPVVTVPSVTTPVVTTPPITVPPIVAPPTSTTTVPPLISIDIDLPLLGGLLP
ncbi:HD domain-containing protein [Ilumatobacter fluminis]|uniref:HD domain-containing protein n=1 Tax=Ilumatobacter fluminis TaxID=467091 RepID=A0A4R7HWU8_9ACTN|nr:HD-GYP domain-containing protein [Ilumatobacter fluminis]TDT14633.1 HD domain-containing protein [Ilumatobacter fluminis]